MARQDIDRLETQVRELGKSVAALSFDSDAEELIKLFRKPGWTTPAEFRLVSGLVDGMSMQVKSIAGLKQVLLTSSREIAEAGQGVGAAR